MCPYGDIDGLTPNGYTLALSPNGYTKVAVSTTNQECVMRANTIQALAAALRGRRVALGWSQAATAAVAGVSRKLVSEVESGKETVELGKVLSLADALGLDINITFALGEDGVPVDPDVLRLEAPAPSHPTRRSAPPPPTETGSLEDLLDDYLRGDDT